MTEARIDFLFRFLHARGVDPTDAHDIVQEVLLAVFEARHDFDAQGIDALAWLSTVARRTATKHRERASRRKEKPTPDEGFTAVVDEAPDPEEHAMLQSRKRFLCDLLAKLSVEQRSVIIAHEIMGMTFEEIAAELQMPLGTVFNHHRVGMAVLRGARTRWQARQSWRGLPVTPFVLAPFLLIRRAWAAGSQSIRGSLGAKGLAVAVAASVALWSATDEGGGYEVAMTAPTLPCIGAPVLTPPEEPAPPAAQVSTPAPPSVSTDRGPQRTPPPEHVRAEQLLMLQARAALNAKSYAAAREALERHARQFPRGRYAGERRQLLERLRAPAVPVPARGRVGYQ